MYKSNVSLSIAPPIINIAPIVCTNVSFSSKSITENITAKVAQYIHIQKQLLQKVFV